MKEKLISEKWLSDYLDGYDVGASVKGDSGAFTMLNNFRVALMEAPAVDAVEVVRCKVCVNNPRIGTKTKGMVWCRKFKNEVRPDGFCSYGERREDNAVD